jgi:hypothetical protein
MCQASGFFFRDVAGCLVRITGETSEEAAWDDGSNDLSPYRTALDAVGAIWSGARAREQADAHLQIADAVLQAADASWQSACASLAALGQLDSLLSALGDSEVDAGFVERLLAMLANRELDPLVSVAGFRILCDFLISPLFAVDALGTFIPFFLEVMSQERHGKIREIGLVSASFVCFSSFVPFVLLLFYSCFFVFVCVCLCSFSLPSFLSLSLSQDHFGTFNPTSFTSIQNQFQMKLIKVNCNLKNNMKKEFEDEDDEEL